MQVWEILGSVKKRPGAKKQTAPQKTDFEKNASKLRSKERELSAQSPVKTIKHRP